MRRGLWLSYLNNLLMRLDMVSKTSSSFGDEFMGPVDQFSSSFESVGLTLKCTFLILAYYKPGIYHNIGSIYLKI